MMTCWVPLALDACLWFFVLNDDDEITEMNQYWDLVNLDSMCIAKGRTLGETFRRSGLHINIRHFTVPSWSEKSHELLHSKYPRTLHRSKSPASGLLRLSDELINLIFGHVGRLSDAACLCLVDGRLLAIGFTRVLQLQKLMFADWTDDRVVCLGGSVRDDDFPESLQELVQKRLEGWPTINPADFTNRFHFLVSNTFIIVDESNDRRRYSHERQDLGADGDSYKMLVTPRYESSHPWVLCNLSKGEYVQATAVAALTGNDGSTPFITGAFNLGHALLSRICWSSDGSIAMGYRGELHRGPWSGDRFEVTTVDKLQTGVEWKNISGEVVDVLSKISLYEYDNILQDPQDL
ncbi:hypothetical protein BDY19DRAFT_616237 [Irpex rosettiformis]|uniref:Uncharacterized protein n=1 Tax=Irpex rosettiformis TaxID=378272 RepID=A0ACB8TP35_9APHY|nr:hypothetical protein BDY19DRAFT_616237 [Irpex rosettiformis]